MVTPLISAQIMPAVIASEAQVIVWGFAALTAIGGWKKLDRFEKKFTGVDVKLAQIITLIHGAPEDTGHSGLVTKVGVHSGKIDVLERQVEVGKLVDRSINEHIINIERRCEILHPLREPQ